MATTIEPAAIDSPASETNEHPSDSQTVKKREAKKKSLAGKAWRQSMMLIRRLHLYSGIFMFPFVLLYGFSGWFFNHPGYFREGTATKFTAGNVAEGILADLPTAEQLAEAVVMELNLESFLVDGPEIFLSDDKDPRFTGSFSYAVNTDQASHTVTINPVDGSGDIKSIPVAESTDKQGNGSRPENPLGMIRSVRLQSNPLETARETVPAILDDLGLSSAEASAGRRSPSVVFSVRADDVPCLVTYNLGNGSVSALRQDARPDLSFKDQLRRMHLARIYSPQYDIRWVWALVVDLMFVSMVFWGVSGLFMWWQVKRTRVLGGAVLVASIAFSAFLMSGMHDNLTEGSGRRGGGHGRGRGAQNASASAEFLAFQATQTSR